MKKKILTALALATTGFVVGELIVHSYLDVMAVEKLPYGIIKRRMNKGKDGTRPIDIYTDDNRKWVENQPVNHIDLENDRKNIVKGYLHKGDNDKVFVVFAHGYRSDHLGDPVNFQQFYHQKGYNFLSVDHVASGNSQGNFVGFGYYESQDLHKWLNLLISEYGEDIKIILHGVSMGGATVCQMASSVPKQVKMIVSDCAFTSGFDEFDNVIKSIGITKTKALLKGFNAINKRVAGYDFMLTDVRESVKNATVPMLFVHGGNDDFVPTKMGYELYEICGGSKDLLIVDGAAHAESIRVDTDAYHSKLNSMIEKYL